MKKERSNLDVLIECVGCRGTSSEREKEFVWLFHGL